MLVKMHWGWFSCKSPSFILVCFLQAIGLGFAAVHLLLDRLIDGVKLLFGLVVDDLEPGELPRVAIADLLVQCHARLNRFIVLAPVVLLSTVIQLQFHVD